MWAWLATAFAALTRIIAPAAFEAGRIAGRREAERDHDVERLRQERDDAVEDAARADRVRMADRGDGRDVGDRLRDGTF